MAPAPSHSPPSIRDLYANSPHIFWALLGAFALTFFLLLGCGLHKIISRARNNHADRPKRSLHVDKAKLRTLILPHLLPKDKGQSENRWWIPSKHLQYSSSPTNINTSSAANLRRIWSFDAFWTSRLSKDSSDIAPFSRDFPNSQSMSPASKTWIVEHGICWELQHELSKAGGPLCTGELLSWTPYIPQKPTISPVSDVAHIAPPPPCLVKGGRNVAGPVTSTPKIGQPPVLFTIEEDKNDSTMDTLGSRFSEDTIWSQDSVDAPNEDTLNSVDDSVPAIVVKECHETSPPDNKHTDVKLGFFEVYEYGMDYLQVPTPGKEPQPSRPILGTVNRSNYGGRFKLSSAPGKRASPLIKTDELPRHRENLAFSGRF